MGEVRRRLDDLLLARVTTGLSAADAAELAQVLAAHPDVDAGSYERAAAAVCLAALDTRAALPEALRSKIEQQAAAFFANARTPRE